MTSVPFTAPPTFTTEEEIYDPTKETVLDRKNGTATRVRVGSGDGSRTVILPTVGSEVVGTRGRGKGAGTAKDDGLTGWNEGVNNLTGFQGNRIESIIDKASSYGPDGVKIIDVEKAEKALNWGDARMGISKDVLQSAIQTQRAKNLNTSYGDALDKVGGPRIGEGMSRGDAERLLENQQGLPEKRRKVEQTRNQLLEEAGQKNLGDNRNIRSGNDTSAMNTYTLAYQQEQEKNRRQDLALARADSKEAKSMEYRLLQDKMDREDWRFGEEMKRYDKNKQKETIQGLIGGLASLGAAFAM